MPPSHQSPSGGKLATSSVGETSLDVKQHHVRESKLRKSARLVEMVNGLQKSMEVMIAKRQYYAQRSIQLEHALNERAPEALYKSLTISTVTVADIMMELEDLHEKTASLEEQLCKLRQSQEQERNSLLLQLGDLQDRHELLEQQSKATQDDLKKQLAEANEEGATIQKKYAVTRKEYHTCTRNIAIMASKIVSVQRENNSLRVEADASHRALVQMEHKFELLQSGSPREATFQEQNLVINQLQCQLEATKFENDKLIAERTASHSVILELQNHIKELQAEGSGHNSRCSESTVPFPFRSILSMPSSDFSHTLPTPSSHHGEMDTTSSNLDNLLTIVRSMSNQSSSASTEVAANTSKHCDGEDSEDASDDEEYEPYHGDGRSTCNDDSPKLVRRLQVTINGLDGSYTGPLGANGLPTGTGTIRFKNGDTYLGALKDGQLHGKGAMYYASNRKTTFRGTFLNNNPVM